MDIWCFFFLRCFGSVSVHIFDINFAMFLQMSRRLRFELWRRILVVSVECPVHGGKAACWKSHHTWWTMSQCNKKSAYPKAKFLESLGCHQPTNGKLVGTSTAFPQWVAIPEAGWASQFHWIVSRDVAEPVWFWRQAKFPSLLAMRPDSWPAAWKVQVFQSCFFVGGKRQLWGIGGRPKGLCQIEIPLTLRIL